MSLSALQRPSSDQVVAGENMTEALRDATPLLSSGLRRDWVVSLATAAREAVTAEINSG